MNKTTRPGQYFACYKFQLDSTRIGLITRVPSMYESSAIKLSVYDRLADSIIYEMEIAEEWGDAGAFFKKISWIYRDNERPKVFTLEEYLYDRSVSEENDSTVETRINSYLLNIADNRADTITKAHH